jgi:hypothetical protein
MKLVSESEVYDRLQCAVMMELTWGVLVGSSTFFLVPFGGMTVVSGLVFLIDDWIEVESLVWRRAMAMLR